MPAAGVPGRTSVIGQTLQTLREPGPAEPGQGPTVAVGGYGCGVMIVGSSPGAASM